MRSIISALILSIISFDVSALPVSGGPSLANSNFQELLQGGGGGGAGAGAGVGASPAPPAPSAPSAPPAPSAPSAPSASSAPPSASSAPSSAPSGSPPTSPQSNPPTPSASTPSGSGSGGNGPTYEQFCAAVDGYAKTSAGGHPPKPSKDIYDSYMKVIGSKLSLKEQALFLANSIWETGGFQFMEEVACKTGTCAYAKYYGRGALQLTWDYNYKEASQDLYNDDRLVRDPDQVAKGDVAWESALWFWNKRVAGEVKKASAADQYKLGVTIGVINSMECPSSPAANNRLVIYNEILTNWKIESSAKGTLAGCVKA